MGDWRSACWPWFSCTLSSSSRPPIILHWWVWPLSFHQRRARQMRSKTLGLSQGLSSSTIRGGGAKIGVFHNVVVFEKRWKSPYNLLQMNHQMQKVGGSGLTGAKDAGNGHGQHQMFKNLPLPNNWPFATSKPAHCFYSIHMFLAYCPSSSPHVLPTYLPSSPSPHSFIFWVCVDAPGKLTSMQALL